MSHLIGPATFGPDNFPVALNGMFDAGLTPGARYELDSLASGIRTTELAVIVLQAIAAFAALGIFIVQVKAMSRRR